MHNKTNFLISLFLLNGFTSFQSMACEQKIMKKPSVSFSSEVYEKLFFDICVEIRGLQRALNMHKKTDRLKTDFTSLIAARFGRLSVEQIYLRRQQLLIEFKEVKKYVSDSLRRVNIVKTAINAAANEAEKTAPANLLFSNPKLTPVQRGTVMSSSAACPQTIQDAEVKL